MRLIFVQISVLFFIISAHAASDVKIKKLVDNFDRLQIFKIIVSGQGPMPLPDDPPPHPRPTPGPGMPPPNQQCPPSGGGVSRSCVEAVCNHLGAFDCSTQDALSEVTRNCRNVTGICVNTICNKVSRFDCDEKSELFTVTNMCRGMVDMSCVDYVCSRLSHFDCDELDELRRVVDQCR